MSIPIVFVAGKDPIEESEGGHSSYLRAHARAAIRLGFEPHLFCLGRTPGVVATDYGIVHSSQSYHYFFRRSGRSGVRVSTAPFQMSKLSTAIYDFLSNGKGRQLIHGFGVWSAAGVAARARLGTGHSGAAVIASCYTILEHEHQGKLLGFGKEHSIRHRLAGRMEYLWVKHAITRLERQAYGKADLVVVNYDSVRLMLESRFGNSLPLRMIPYSSDTGFQSAEEEVRPSPVAIAKLEPSDAPLIVAVSRHDPRKGLNLLLHALARLKGEGVPFRACLIGSGQLYEEHRRLASRLQLDGTTVLTGFVEDPRDYLCSADIFVLPSLEEGSGSLSVIEALQAGVATIASAIDGICEDLKDGENALLFEPGNIAGLATSLQQLIADASLRQRLGQSARQTFAERFSSDQFTTALADLYAELGFSS